jgi:hypothetical protein
MTGRTGTLPVTSPPTGKVPVLLTEVVFVVDDEQEVFRGIDTG